MNIKKIIYVLQAIGIKGIIRTVINSIVRNRIDKKYTNPTISYPMLVPGKFIHANMIPRGIHAEFDHSDVDVTFLSKNIIKVSWEPERAPFPYTIDKSDWEDTRPDVSLNKENCSLSFYGYKVTIGDSGEIRFIDNNEKTFRIDTPPIRIGTSVRLITKLHPEEHICGLGERAGSLNLRPGKYTSWNSDIGGNYSTGDDPLYIGTPVYLSISTNGIYLVFFENSYKSAYKIDDQFEATFDGGIIRYYVIFGSLSTIYDQLSILIGKPSLPPRWVLGYHQCRWGYRSEAEIRKVVQGFEQHNFPISAIHLDIDYMDGFRVFTIDSNRFPNMKMLSKELLAKGIHLVASVNPAVKIDHNYWIYTDGVENDVFCKLPDKKMLKGVSWPGWCVFPDFTNPETRLWWQDFYQYYLDNGISGIWHDMNEPASFLVRGDMTLPSATLHSMDGHNSDHHEAHNLYGLLMNQSGYEGLRKYSPTKRPWIFSRSGWAGLQKYAWNWTGDIASSWESLKQTIPTLLGLGISGHAFSGADIGGYSGNPDAELYLRWFQMSTFFPLFRTHSAIGSKPREPWVYGEKTSSIIRNYLKLRYRLIPYLYTLFMDTVNAGMPPLRPLFWNDPSNSRLWDIDDEFLLGEELLIAPVIYPGAYTRKVTLPAGQWYSFWDDEQFIGDTDIEVKVNVDNIPVFIKAGTVLPLEEEQVLYLHIYPTQNKNTTNHLYSDIGDGYGPWRLDIFTTNYKINELELTWEKEGEYLFPYEKVMIVLHANKFVDAVIDDNKFPAQDNILVTPIFHKLFMSYIAD